MCDETLYKTEGAIFDVQRFCMHDGPGIRTTVFLKGCNLRCAWCHNPESQICPTQLMFYPDKCTGCGKCRAFCDKAGTDACTGCGKCAAVCQSGARMATGSVKTVADVMDVVSRDIPYYETSKGGVTFSGGEPLLQTAFIEALLTACREKKIATAVETAGCVPTATFERLLPLVDLFLFDLKAIDADVHKRCTGVDNAQILANAAFLKERGANVLFRMPVIPGYNDTEIDAVAAFAKPYPLELLAYHATGESKYTALGRAYAPHDVTPPTKEEMQEAAQRVGAVYRPTGI